MRENRTGSFWAMDAAIRTRGLTKRYGDLVALDSVDLEVPPGVVFGFLGPNGAGKSTLIRMLVGLARPSSGSGEVLGHDVVEERNAIHAEIGYLPGDHRAYDDLTPRQHLEYLGNLRGGVDGAWRDSLVERFGLPLDRPIGDLSHGNKQKVGIVAAFMHRPRLVLLDEPTQGLDPLMQHAFIELVGGFRDEGGTVFLSSHVMAEVEALADTVAIVRDGRLVVTTDAEELRSTATHRVTITFEDGSTPPTAALEALDSVRELVVEDSRARMVVEGSMAELITTVAPWGVERIVSEELDLGEIFLRYYERPSDGPEG